MGDSPGGGKSKRGGARPNAGRKSHEEKLAEELAKRGCLPAGKSAVAVPAAAAPSAPFDRDAAVLFFQTVLDAADEANAEQVAAMVAKALNSDDIAARLKSKAQFSPAMKKMAAEDLADLCRANGINIGPGARLAAAAVQIGIQQVALRKEIKALIAAAPPKTP